MQMPGAAGPDGWLSDHEVRELGEGRIVVRDGFLGPDALACAQAAWALRPELTPAAIGREHRHVPDVRGDHTAFLSELEVPPSLARAWQAFEELRVALNREAWLGLRRFGVQLACYPGDGARYVRHTDAFRGDANRRVTAILYLNVDWAPEHGGMLRVHLPAGPVDVPPLLGRLVLFLSDSVPHEVLPTWRPRLALTAWYRGAEAVPLLADPQPPEVGYEPAPGGALAADR